MIRGLVRPLSYESFCLDVRLLRVIKDYAESDRVDLKAVEDLDGYQRIYPYSKIEVYNDLIRIIVAYPSVTKKNDPKVLS